MPLILFWNGAWIYCKWLCMPYKIIMLFIIFKQKLFLVITYFISNGTVQMVIIFFFWSSGVTKWIATVLRSCVSAKYSQVVSPNPGLKFQLDLDLTRCNSLWFLILLWKMLRTLQAKMAKQSKCYTTQPFNSQDLFIYFLL